MFSNEIIKILDDLSKRMGMAIDWSGKNIMPYLEELMGRFVQWEISTSIIWGLLAVVLCFSGCLLLKYSWNHINEYFGDIDEWASWGVAVSVSMILGGIIVLLTQCFDVCEAVYLPEKVVYDYISRLIASK